MSSGAEHIERAKELVRAFTNVLTPEVSDILDYESIVLILYSPAITSRSSQNPKL